MRGQRGARVDEPAGFREFVQTHSRALLRTAWLLTGDWASAEDLVQSALAKTWPKWDSITRVDAPQVYVRRVVVTTFLGWRRLRSSTELVVSTVPDRAVDDQVFALSDLRQSLRTAMLSLPPRQRAVITLRYFSDLSEKQTAEILGCSVGAVKSHASKAIARLREQPGLAELYSEEIGA
jgi:RNA polymerase sigma-70 factor (sigma-E family)